MLGLDEASSKIDNDFQKKKNQVVGKAVEGVIEYTVKSVRATAMQFVRKTLREYLYPNLGGN